MSLDAERASGGDDPTLLFEEVLALRERGEPLDWDALARRAGERVEELRARLQLMRHFEDLSFLLADEDPPATDVDPGRIGRYELGELLGEGGLSRVYSAHDEVLGREVALKLLSPTAVPIADARAWMMSEGRSLAQLEHDSIVRVFDVAEHQGFAFIAMERIQGASLFEILEALRAQQRSAEAEGHGQAACDGALRLARFTTRCRLVARLARALEYCHARGVVHRDVKPGNVLVGADGVPKLIDFGLSHSERDESSLRITQRLLGTVAYFSPEQVDQGRSGASPMSDQFSLGVILYELLTLAHPFARSTQAGTMSAISQARPKPPRKLDPSIPLDLETITLHALERLPADRYESVGALADDLEAFLEHRAIRVQAPSALKLTRLWLRRHRAAVAAVGGGVLAVGALWFGGQMWERVEFKREVRARRAALDAGGKSEGLFPTVRGWWIRAREHDAALLAGLALPRVSPELGALWQAASERLHAEVDPLYASAAAETRRDERERLFLELQARWRTALDEELYSAPPGSVHDEPVHFLGQVELPEGGELWRFDPNSLPAFPRLVPVTDHVHLQQGLYRFAWRNSEGLMTETEFRVFLAEPRWALEPVALDEAHARELVAIDAQHVSIPLKGRVEEHELAAFELAPRPVTWAEVKTVLPRPEIERLIGTLGQMVLRADLVIDLADSAPAVVTWEQARRYVRQCGARLPTALELYVAQRNGVVTRSPDSMLYFEWVTSNSGTSDRDCFQYAYKVHDKTLIKPAGVFDSELTVEARPDDPNVNTCFRIARSRVER